MKNKDIVFGTRPVIEAIKSQKRIEKIFIQKNIKKEPIQKIKILASKFKYNISLVPKEKLNRISRKNHQGVFARISPIEIIPIDKMIQNELKKEVDPIYLLLDGVTDPRNFGAILRSANATSVNGVIICSSSSAPINEDVLKASSGAIFNVPISKVNNLKDAIYLLKENNIEIMGLEQNAKKLIYDINLKNPLAI